jgi:mannose-6-phosphate isomerase-like protein (cupin superfamily)
MHYVGKFDESAIKAHSMYENHSEGYGQVSLVDHSAGSLHTGLGVHQLKAGGTLLPHVHSYEEGFYILSGEVLISLNDKAYLLGSGDYGAITVGSVHALRNVGQVPVRWLQMAAPQPKPEGKERDTFFLKNTRFPTEGKPLDLNDLGGYALGHFDASQIPPMEDRPPAAPGLEGVSLNWLIDEKLGARHHRMALIEYQPGVGIGLHDHAFEEGYFYLSGEAEATLDGESYHIQAGDVVWTGVGCVHSFANKSQEPVRWLETFSPQPPAENAFRFMEQWEKRAEELEGV